MRLGIIGGALQGTEVAYLAHQAGIRTLIIDRRPDAPALSLADEAVVMDVNLDPRGTRRLLETCDVVLPANENEQTLSTLVEIISSSSIPIIFDPSSYRTTSSKTNTNQLMRENETPMPRDWPECGFPVVVKPSHGSGSHGVSRVDRHEDMPRAIDSTRRYDDDIVIQEFLSGPSISLELLGKGNEVFPLQTTQVILDEHFDCKMVLAPCQERFLDEGSFFEIGCRLGKAVRLQGIMDVEAIVHNGQPKVLELDARFPSQTPSAVLHSTGMNMVGMLCDWFVRDMPPRISHAEPRQAIYEHIQVRNGRLESFGEDMMAKCTGLHLVRGFHGADVALTDYNSDEAEWRATLITTGPDLASAWNRREKVLEHIMENEGLGVRYDSSLGGVAR